MHRDGWLEIERLVGDDDMLQYRDTIRERLLQRDQSGGAWHRIPMKDITLDPALKKALRHASVRLERASSLVVSGYVDKKHVMSVFADVFVDYAYALAEYNQTQTDEAWVDSGTVDFTRTHTKKFAIDCAKWLKRKKLRSRIGPILLREAKERPEIWRSVRV